jgi:hypothetical protein
VQSACIQANVYRCQDPFWLCALLGKRTENPYRPGLTRKNGKPVCYTLSVGGDPAAKLFDIDGENEMERNVALKKIGKLLGKKFGYRINAKAPTPEERAAARLALPAAIEERNKLKEQREARYLAILAADAEFQNLKAAHKAAAEKADRLSSKTRHFKITVGDTSSGLFFMVKAEGDSWEEIIEKLTNKKVAA